MKICCEFETLDRLRGGKNPNEELSYLQWLADKTGRNVYEVQELMSTVQKKDGDKKTHLEQFEKELMSVTATFRRNGNEECCLGGNQIKAILVDGNQLMTTKQTDSLKPVIQKSINIEPRLIPVGKAEDLKIETRFEYNKSRGGHISRYHYFDPPRIIAFTLYTVSPRLNPKILRQFFEIAPSVGALTEDGRTPFDIKKWDVKEK